MAKLTMLKPRVQVLDTSVGTKTKSGSFSSESRGTRHQRGYGTAWDKLRKRILERDCGICQPCKRDGELHVGNEVDHIVPKSQGGTDDESNLEVICTKRHRLKTQREAQGG